MLFLFILFDLFLNIFSRLEKNLYYHGVQILNGRTQTHIMLSYILELVFIILCGFLIALYLNISWIYQGLKFYLSFLSVIVIQTSICILLIIYKVKHTLN